MKGFQLFDAEHRSSWPLDIAYEAAKLTEPEKAKAFFRNLQYATIVETRQTTKEEEILRVAGKSGLNGKSFLQALHDGSAEEEFHKDLAYTRSLGICSLPAFDIQYGDKTVLIKSLISYEIFTEIINRIINQQ